MKWPVAKLFSLLIIAISAVFSLWARGQLPDQPIATHFNMLGHADGFMPRDTALGFGPLLLCGLTALMWVLPAVQPQRARLERSAAVYGVAWIGVVTVVAFAHLFTVGHALGWQVSLRPVWLAPGILFIVLGNVLPKTRFNYVVGVRTPWTLSDERVWDRTHRLAGPVMMLGGLIMTGAALTLPPQWMHIVTLGAALVASAVVVVASYLYARSLKLT